MFRGAISDGDLRLLRVFRTVVENGGFTAAEVALNKSKSAISLDIAHLEQRMGTKLCVRGRSGFRLTDEGQIVYLASLQLFTDVEKFRDRVATAVKALTGRVSLLLVDNLVSVAAGPMTRAIGDFAKRHGKVEIVMDSATPAGVEQGILDGEADLGVSVVPRELSSIEMIPLFREELRLYCGRNHELAQAGLDGLTAEAVKQHRLVMPGVTEDPDFAALAGGFRTDARSSNIDARILLVLSGAFLGFLPPHFVAPWVESGELLEVLPRHFRTENTFYVLFKKSARQSAAAQAFLSILLASFEKAKRMEISKLGQLA
ncbi:LysR family transcriptional regulator [Zavarzinia compransoris]|uniref:LysR family transcriptional regulator n=1 Tax=Zavarzinia compransoris TaxID=1264899 RepID=A0A317E693_9PROT|nr:LysR family transcriptional regulator [Zavarzinia compransoris]PWR21726.1 LysR family transcriptional regulator [Zavarzinia compransoris]TDP45486.1 DNA-binding transcriptional LysR family regulator [Zavarzinia compransoris]